MPGMPVLVPSFALLLLSLAVVRGESVAATEEHDQSLGLSWLIFENHESDIPDNAVWHQWLERNPDCSGTVEKRSAGTGFSDSEKAMLVNMHNMLRYNVSPPASNMQQMTWSKELEDIAKAFAANCVFAHNSQKSSQSQTFNYVGENLYMSFGTVAEPEDVVNLWYNEVQYYDYYTNSCAVGKMCRHYTQVVWAYSYKLGCARQACPRGKSFVVCNYGIGGNWEGQRPYRT